VKEVAFADDGIRFARYPYPGASVFPNGVAPYAAIREVDPDAAPPEVRLASGEILFVPATQRDALRRVVAERGLAIVRRVDVWDLLLEPFLDTEFDAAHEERTLEQLAETGVPRDEALRLRRRFGPRMLRYNAILWDWTHLGLSDLLDAHVGRLVLAWLPFVRRRFERLYWEAMAIAGRGSTRPGG
jgi:hypothetical protein